MGLFRRRPKETLNEQLLREAGLDVSEMLGDTPPVPPREQVDPLLPLHPRQRVPEGASPDPREWDAAVTVSAADLGGDEARFTTIPGGDVIVSEETGDVDLSPLADALERHVKPPYRALAVRQDGDLWAVCARRIEVARIPFSAGEKLELSWNGNDEELRVDGEPTDAAVPRELEEIGEAASSSYYVEAERIDGNLWEVRATGI